MAKPIHPCPGRECDGCRKCSTHLTIATKSTPPESKVPHHIVCLSFDFDTQSGFIARGMTTPTPLSRGEFGLVGARRILALLKAFDLRATWFIPGFTIESHPRLCEAVVAHGHEVAHHSWAHVPPAQQSRAEEEADLVRANAAIARRNGEPPRGYRPPGCDLP